MNDESTVAHLGLADEDAILAVSRAGGGSEDEEADRPTPRGEDEPLLEYLERVSTFLRGDRVVTEDSAEVIRRSRQERTMQLERAIGMALPTPRIGCDEADAVLARLDRTRESIMRGRVFDDDSTALVRRERARRSVNLRRSGS